MSSGEPKLVLFVGGPLHGASHQWTDPPDFHPHVTTAGLIAYHRVNVKAKCADAVFAPDGMPKSAVLEALARLSADNG